MSSPVPPPRSKYAKMTVIAEEPSAAPSESGPIMPGEPLDENVGNFYPELDSSFVPARGTVLPAPMPFQTNVEYPPEMQMVIPTRTQVPMVESKVAKRPPRQSPDQYHPSPEGNVDSPILLSPEKPKFVIPKRSTTVRRVELDNKGNLQIDVPVPPDVLQNSTLKSGKEVEYLRYTAATCDADEFKARGYTLRASNSGRHVELFIVVTMYNEDQVLFARTMHALFENIKDFLRKGGWGEKAWKNIVVCIVSDGRAKINPGVLNVLAVNGCYQDGIARKDVGGKPVAAHIFEYTTQIDVLPDMSVTTSVPMQVIFCLKEENAKKINSHRWFFNAFAPILQPNVCVLIDVGTRPLENSLYHLWNVFDRHPNVGGACGEIRADISPGWSKAFSNPIVAAQNFEYKISNTFDKPLESAFGYISVLPGAFSAYRYAALSNYDTNKGPLASYFRGEAIHSGKEAAGVFENNLFLAEDRILCFELVAKPGEAWRLRYESKSHAVTDVPEVIPELVSQRRRWLNGSTFAAMHAITNWGRIYQSGHGFLRKIAFTLEFLYIIASQLVGFLNLGNFYLIFSFLLDQNVPGPTTEPPYAFGPDAGYWVAWVFNMIYILLLVTQFIVSLGNRPGGSKQIYRVEAWLWAVLMALVLYLIGFTAYQIISQAVNQINLNGGGAGALWTELRTNYSFTSLLAAFAATWVAWGVAGLLFLDPWHMINSFVQFMLLSPFWVNVLQVFAYCNVHDVAWGTKGDDTGKPSLPSAPAKVQGGKVEVVLDLPDAEKTVEASQIYQQQLALLAQGPIFEPVKVDAKTKREDQFKIYRTRVLLIWVICNALLVFIMTNDKIVNAMKAATGSIMNPYLIFLFFVALAFGIVKMCGVLYYLIVQQILDFREQPTQMGSKRADSSV